MPKNFDVFLSYNRNDKVAVVKLAEALRDSGLNVWLDDWVLPLGEPWQRALEEAITAIPAVLILFGEHGIGPWQDMEMNAVLHEFVRRKARIIPVLLPKAPEPAELPIFLRQFNWLDLRAGLTEDELERLVLGIRGKKSKTPRKKPPSAPKAWGLNEALIERQLQIAEQHNRLLEAQLQPIFRFVTTTRSIENEVFDALEIWNDGAPIESYTIWQAAYLEVSKREILPEGTSTYTTNLIPSYYFIRRDYEGDARTGRLVTLYAWRDSFGRGYPGVNMTKEYNRLVKEVRDKYGFDVIIQKRVFLEIYYTDRLSTQKNLTYEIYPPSPRFGGHQVPERRRNTYSLGMHMCEDLNNLTAENLFSRWDKFVAVVPDLKNLA